MVNSGGELRVAFKRTGPSDTARLAELLAQAPLLASLDLRWLFLRVARRATGAEHRCPSHGNVCG